MQTCEICGKTFRNLNLNHLRTHGVVSWEQYRELVLQRKRPDQTLIREVAHSLLHGNGIPDEHARKLAEINAGARAQADGITSVFAMRQTLRALRLMDALQGMEDIAYDKETLAKASLDNLLDMMKFVSGDLFTILKQLSEVNKKTNSFSGAVESVLNQYNFINASGVGTDFDRRLPTDPRKESQIMARVRDLVDVWERGEGSPEDAMLTIDAKPEKADNDGTDTEAT